MKQTWCGGSTLQYFAVAMKLPHGFPLSPPFNRLCENQIFADQPPDTASWNVSCLFDLHMNEWVWLESFESVTVTVNEWKCLEIMAEWMGRCSGVVLNWMLCRWIFWCAILIKVKAFECKFHKLTFTHRWSIRLNPFLVFIFSFLFVHVVSFRSFWMDSVCAAHADELALKYLVSCLISCAWSGWNRHYCAKSIISKLELCERATVKS